MSQREKSIFFENPDCESKGYNAEKIVFDCIKDVFCGRNCSAKHGYIMNFAENKFTIESDILLLDRELGINIFEVKGIRIDNIRSISIDGWHCEGIYKDIINPNYQVDRNAANILDFLKDYFNNSNSNSIGVKPIVVLPYITKEQWKKKGFDGYAFLPPIMFKDDLKTKNSFFSKLNDIPYKCTAKRSMKDYEFDEIKNSLFGKIENKNVGYSVISEEDFLRNLLK